MREKNKDSVGSTGKVKIYQIDVSESDRMICDRCSYAGVVRGFPDEQDMFVCDKEGDPRIPFDMEIDTEECPCFEPMEEE